MPYGRIIHISVFPGWIICVTYRQSLGYQCWVVTPDHVVLSDGEQYTTSSKALATGRWFIQQSLIEIESDWGTS